MLLFATFAVGTSNYKASIYSHPAPVYDEEKLIYQPFTQEYEHNIKITKIENQLQEHEQNKGRLEIIQRRTIEKQQIYSHLPLLASFISCNYFKQDNLSLGKKGIKLDVIL